jgi:hypothetical protein
MVTQEVGQSIDAAAEEQRRKSVTAAAIRKGTIKISDPQPILWVEGVPDASADQHTVSSSVPHEEAVTSGPQSNGDDVHGVALSTDEEQRGPNLFGDSPNPFGDTPSPKQRRTSQQIQDSSNSKRCSTPTGRLTDQRNSTIESSPGSSNQMQAKKKRRSGTIRTVFRKVFGRRDKSDSKHMSPPQSRAGPKHEYTRSVSFRN